jgi:hypothetical protein
VKGEGGGREEGIGQFYGSMANIKCRERDEAVVEERRYKR